MQKMSFCYRWCCSCQSGWCQAASRRVLLLDLKGEKERVSLRKRDKWRENGLRVILWMEHLNLTERLLCVVHVVHVLSVHVCVQFLLRVHLDQILRLYPPTWILTLDWMFRMVSIVTKYRQIGDGYWSGSKLAHQNGKASSFKSPT